MADSRLNTLLSINKTLGKGSIDFNDIEQSVHTKLSDGVLASMKKDNADWKNIQDVIKEAVKNLADVATLQNQSISQLRKEIEALKSDKTIKDNIDSKLDKKEFQASFNRLTEIISKKVEHIDFIKQFEALLDVSSFEDFKRSNELRLNEIQATYTKREELEDTLTEFANIHKKINNLQTTVNTKSDKAQITAQQSDIDRRFQICDKRFSVIDEQNISLNRMIENRYTRDEVDIMVEGRAQQVILSG